MNNNRPFNTDGLIRHPFTDLDDHDLAEAMGESVTQPDLAMTPMEIMQRFTRNLPMPPIQHEFGFDEDLFDGDPTDDQLLDLQQDDSKFEAIDRLRIQALNTSSRRSEREIPTAARDGQRITKPGGNENSGEAPAEPPAE